ncbi:hypothetical protein HDV00_009544 [Rhizophlyctis rosea]|nr:hypothetical protein HDV00_009544 [Rhizophlyctis rosea]
MLSSSSNTEHEHDRFNAQTPTPTCDTGFAREPTPLTPPNAPSPATCFFDIPGAKDKRWGWTSKVSAAPYDAYWPILFGAGTQQQCNQNLGTQGGQLHVQYFANKTVTATYIPNTANSWTYSQVHLYIGNEVLPKQGNDYTTAPGQHTFKDETDPVKLTWTKNGQNAPFYVVGHAVGCGYKSGNTLPPPPPPPLP